MRLISLQAASFIQLNGKPTNNMQSISFIHIFILVNIIKLLGGASVWSHILTPTTNSSLESPQDAELRASVLTQSPVAQTLQQAQQPSTNTAIAPYLAATAAAASANLHEHDKRKLDFYEFRHVVADGVQRALDECRQRFKWDRWNCPKKAFSDILSREPLPSNKELALVRALIASGIVLSLIQSCSYGKSSICGCTNPTSLPGHMSSTGSAPGAPIEHFAGFQMPDSTDNLVGVQSITTNNRYYNEHHDYHSSYPGDAANVENSATVTAVASDNSNPKSKFAWNGCDEVIKFGFRVAKMYLDSQDVAHDEASKMINAHNYQVGRHTVIRKMKKRCKCHGVSGACQINTCWTVLPSMSEVGEYLKRQYRVAAKVGAMTAVETNIATLSKELTAISVDKLVFADASPDYCYEEPKLGINGTLGRYCSRAKHRPDGTEVSRNERDSCDRLCTKCGYRIKKERLNVEKQCDCRFVYCCSVECKRCPYAEETFKCVRHS